VKDWQIRLATTGGAILALVVLWNQFGPTLNFGRAEAVARASAERGNAGEEFRWEGRVADHGAVEIKGVNGSITAETAPGRTVEVQAVKRGRRSDPGEVRIEVLEHGDGVTLCAVYPGPGNRCTVGKEGRMNTRNNDVTVNFHVLVPSGVSFIGRTVNGSVKIPALESDVSIETVSGSVEVATTGTAQATTVNGSIKAVVGARELNRDLNFTTVNGSIAVTLSDGVGADVRATTVNGSLTSDFPLNIQRRLMTGTIGQGGASLRLETVNGAVRVRRGP
jgi:hypothetical protein